MVGIWLVALTLLLPACDKSTKDSDISDLSAAATQRLLHDSKSKNKPDLVLLVDPRSPREFAQGHIPGAKNIQLDEIKPGESRLVAYDKYDTIIVYGSDPGSPIAKAMTKRFLMNDYREVYRLQGGLKEWIESGGQVEAK